MLSSFLYRWGNRGSQASNNLPRLESTKAKSCLVLNPSCMMGWLFIFQEEDNGIRVSNAVFIYVSVYISSPPVCDCSEFWRGGQVFWSWSYRWFVSCSIWTLETKLRSSWRETSIRNLLNSLSSPDNRMFSHLQSPPSPRFCSKKNEGKGLWRWNNVGIL